MNKWKPDRFSGVDWFVIGLLIGVSPVLLKTPLSLERDDETLAFGETSSVCLDVVIEDKNYPETCIPIT